MPIEDTSNSYEYKLKQAGLAEPLSTYLSDPLDPDRLKAGFPALKTDPLTGGSALQSGGLVVSNSTVTAVVTRRAVALLGQSVEAGSARSWVSGSVAKNVAFESQYVQDPVNGAALIRQSGSIIPHLDSMLRTQGHKVTWRNCALGSISFIRDACGQATVWNANLEYYQQRASIGAGDAGDYGTVLIEGSRVFRCTTGRLRYVTSDPGVVIPASGGQGNIDYIVTTGTNTSGPTKPPALSTAAVNDVVTDGTIQWTCISTTLGTLSPLKVLVSGDTGFDPLGILARTKTMLDAVAGVTEKWVFLSQGQSDAQAALVSQPTVRGWYKQAIESITNYMLAQGYKVAIGFTTWNPLVALAGGVFNDAVYKDRYSALSLAVNDALTITYPSNINVIRGANWYEAFGYGILCYPEPPATTGTGPHVQAVEHPRMAKEWFDKLLASGKW